MKIFTTLLLLIITFQSYAQRKNFGIEFSPLALADIINFRAIQFGFENRLVNRFTLYNELGVKYIKGPYENTDTVRGKSNGFRYKIELRYYFKNNRDTIADLDKLAGFYVGANVFYSQNNFDYQINYRPITDSLGGNKDNFKVKKIIKSPNLILGKELVVLKKVYFDFYAGFGLRFRTIETQFKEFNKEKDMLISPIDITVRGEMDKVNSEDKQTVLPNFSGGVRIGIRF